MIREGMTESDCSSFDESYDDRLEESYESVVDSDNEEELPDEETSAESGYILFNSSSVCVACIHLCNDELAVCATGTRGILICVALLRFLMTLGTDVAVCEKLSTKIFTPVRVLACETHLKSNTQPEVVPSVSPTEYKKTINFHYHVNI